MSESHLLLEELRQLLPLEEESVDAFDELVARLVELQEPSSIRPLLQLLEDDFPLSGVMGSLSGNLGRFPGEDLARELLAELPDLRRRRPFRAEDLVKRFLGRSPGPCARRRV